MNRFSLVGTTVLALIISACGGGNGSSFSAPRVNLQVLHASADAPAVNVLVDGDPVLTGVNFKEGSEDLRIRPGTYDIVVEAIIPGGNLNVIELPQTPLDRDTRYTVLAIGSTEDLLTGGVNPLQALVLANPDTPVAAAAARAQVVHASPAAPEVAVYVTAPGADLSAEAPLGTFSFGEELGPVEVPAGSYQVRVTLPPAPPAAPTVVYDAGIVDLNDGDNVVIAAVNNTTTGTAPITLVVLPQDSTPIELLDVATPVNIRAVHDSPDAPAVDVIVNDNFGAPLFSALTYPNATDFAAPPPGAYNIKIVDSATQGVIALNVDTTLSAGVQYTALATGFLVSLQDDSVILIDDDRRVATEARVRLVHGSPSAGTVDIYVVPAGTDITTVEPNFEDVVLGQDTGYISAAPGDYDVAITPANDDTVVAIGAAITVSAGNVATVIARDAPGGGAPFGLIELDDDITP